jgi:hypothetical protein
MTALAGLWTCSAGSAPAAAPRADSMPTSFGKVSIATILLLAEADSFQEQVKAIKADETMSEGTKSAEHGLAVAKFTKALGETLAAFMEGMLMWASRYLAGQGAAVAAAEAAKWAKDFSSAAGKVFAVAGLCIAAVDLVLAIRSGQEDRIVEASAGVAQAGIGVATTFGAVSAAGAVNLSVLVVLAVGSYYICKNLPKIAEKAQQLELAENSQSVVDHTRAGMQAAKRAEAAGNAWQAAMMAGDPKLAASLERKMGAAIVDSWNEIVQASTFALDAPGGVDEAFRAHVGFTDLVANKPRQDLTGANLHIFAAGYEDFLQAFRYGVEDMTDKAMLATGNIGFIEYAAQQQQRSLARATG